MYRKQIEKLIKWKSDENRKPLIIKGARQVGKTWLMKEFGREQYQNYAYINFDGNERMKILFDGDYDIERIIQGLKIESKVNIEKEKTLIIFDEVQEVPKALSSLKYFYENEPDYHIVAAGSLLGIALHEGTSFPVGKVEFMNLYPLNFEEFLLAIGEDELRELIDTHNIEMLKVFKDKIINRLREYFYVGGMPEVVVNYSKNHNLDEVREIQLRLLEAYDNDFSKHAPNNIVPRIRDVWNNIPSQLAKENKKFIYGLIKEGARAREYEMAINWLLDTGLIYKVNRVKDYKKPIKAYQDLGAFKLYFFDVGLLSALAGCDSRTLIEGDDIFVEFKGSLSEDYVLCELKSNNYENIFYWANDTGTSEVDFILDAGSELLPIEVKANTNLQAKSLKAFIKKFGSLTNVRTSLADFKEEDNLINIPLYSISKIEKIIENYKK